MSNINTQRYYQAIEELQPFLELCQEAGKNLQYSPEFSGNFSNGLWMPFQKIEITFVNCSQNYIKSVYHELETIISWIELCNKNLKNKLDLKKCHIISKNSEFKIYVDMDGVY